MNSADETDGNDVGIAGDNDSDVDRSGDDSSAGIKSEHLYHITDKRVAEKPKPFSMLTLAEKMERHNQRRARNVRYRALAKQGLKDCAKISCNQCNMKIAGYKNLKTHVEYMHLKIRNAVCKVCAKSFYNNHKLQVHTMDVHTRQCQACKEYVVETEPWKEGTNNRMVRIVPCDCGEQVEVCSVFNRPKGTFTKRSKVNQIHACSTCGKVFPNGSRLRRHVKTHLDTFDFVCDLCGKAFRCKPSLNQHMKNEHAVFDSLNVCKICDRVYQSEHTLEIHMAKAHSSATPDTTYDIVQQTIPDGFGIRHTEMASESVNIAQNTNPVDNRQYNYANYGY